MFTTDGLNRELRQSEILTNLVQHSFDSVTGENIFTPHDFCIILSQDCDLLNHYNQTMQDADGEAGAQAFLPPVINGVLLFELQEMSAENLKALNKGRKDVRAMRQNEQPRFQTLDAVTANFDLETAGLPELLVDFRHYFTLPPVEIYRQIQKADGARRRCRLGDLFRENLQNRLANYIQRVALPDTLEADNALHLAEPAQQVVEAQAE